ncbi:hypothetical protein BGZ63DRAFT_188397 [Mariannaea sp. PMI_226]|nr:hypothetical protein BGZ63DRAFT_188397 [Mariannaea sp. PMI_226]
MNSFSSPYLHLQSIKRSPSIIAYYVQNHPLIGRLVGAPPLHHGHNAVSKNVNTIISPQDSMQLTPPFPRRREDLLSPTLPYLDCTSAYCGNSVFQKRCNLFISEKSHIKTKPQSRSALAQTISTIVFPLLLPKFSGGGVGSREFVWAENLTWLSILGHR